MGRPITPNTAAATAARMRTGQNNAADRLRDAGWICISPTRAKALLAQYDALLGKQQFVQISLMLRDLLTDG